MRSTEVNDRTLGEFRGLSRFDIIDGMPVSVRFEDTGTFVLDATGIVTFAEVSAAFAEILADPRLVKNTTILAVNRSSVTTAPSYSELRALVEELKPVLARSSGTMVIAAESLFIYGVVRMFATLAELVGIGVQIFRTEDDARAWIRAR